MNRIEYISTRMSMLFSLLCYLIPAFAVLFWLFPEAFFAFGIDLGLLASNATINLNSLTQSLGFLITLLSVGVLLYGLNNLKQLFDNYAKGIIFSLENALIYKKLAKALFLLAVTEIVSIPLHSIVLSYQNPVGERFINMGIDSAHICYVITGFVVLVISHVMEHAHEIDRDAELTV